MTADQVDLIEPLLEVEGIDAGYGQSTVIRDVSLSVERGQVVALLGANGAGKTTILRTIAGLVKPTKGAIRLDDRDVTKLRPYERARRGLCHIPEGRGIFRDLTVRENLDLFLPNEGRKRDRGVDAAVEAFPVLGERIRQQAGTLSGGEQQMLATARAFVSSPELVLVDELSMGLAPIVVDGIYKTLHQLNATGVGLLVVEQYVPRALQMAHKIYIVARGRVAWSGPPDELEEERLVASYLGVDEETSRGETDGAVIR
jgi:branched-chain amino acid transport system ATP-binding protein